VLLTTQQFQTPTALRLLSPNANRGAQPEDFALLTCQAAYLTKELANLHAFDGGNHRTAYLVAKMFLTRNDKRLTVDLLHSAYLLISHIETKTIEQVQDWIEHGEGEGS
jgi:prophage maintenance system killer protein